VSAIHLFITSLQPDAVELTTGSRVIVGLLLDQVTISRDCEKGLGGFVYSSCSQFDEAALLVIGLDVSADLDQRLVWS
jgi:hypothetical protein